MIKVIFRKDKTGEVTAVFPQMAGDRFYLMTCASYAHVGQHGSISFNWYYESTVPAEPEEYKDLLLELQSIYGGELKVSYRITTADYLMRRAEVGV